MFTGREAHDLVDKDVRELRTKLDAAFADVLCVGVEPLDFAAPIRDDPLNVFSHLWRPAENASKTCPFDQDTGGSMVAIESSQCGFCLFEFGLLAPLVDEKIDTVLTNPCLDDRKAIPRTGSESRIDTDYDRSAGQCAANRAEMLALNSKLSLFSNILLV